MKTVYAQQCDRQWQTLLPHILACFLKRVRGERCLPASRFHAALM
jgi:hypothetical protein